MNSSSHLETRIIFEAAPDAHGWLDRKLPCGGLTSILTEQFFWGDHHNLPEPGYRFTVYESQDGTSRSTHWSPGDWVVSRVAYYPRPSDDEPAIAVCRCEYSPIERDWKPLGNGRPIPELLAEMDSVPAAIETDAAGAIESIEPDPVLLLSCGGKFDPEAVRVADIVGFWGYWDDILDQEFRFVKVRCGEGETCDMPVTEEEHRAAIKAVIDRFPAIKANAE